MPGEFEMFSLAFNQMLDSLTDTNENLKKHMRELQNEIARREALERELENRREAAESASRAKSEFLSNVSHEIRTPLNVVASFSELLSMTELNKKQKDYIRSIQSGSVTLLNLITDVLDLSKIESGKLSIELAMFDLHELMNDLESLFSKHASDKSLAFEVEVSNRVPCYIISDQQRLKQILMNLLSNAFKFTEYGSVRLRVDASSELHTQPVDLCFSVEDSGIGIPEKYQHSIFNQFEQVDGQDTRKYGGTGLGLAISKKLAGLLGGELAVTSEAGRGSTFTLTLVEVEASGVYTDLLDDGRAGDIHMPDLKYGTILLADDIKANRELVRNILENQPVEIIEAENGRQAVELARMHRPDVILMDIKMPEVDGIEATRQIRADEALKHIPVIALTASSITGSGEQQKQSLFDAYITKPIRVSTLMGSLAEFLNS